MIASLDVAARVPTESTSVTVYFRHVYLPSTGDPDPFRVQPNAGRWGTDWTLHTAESVHVALAEYCRQASEAVNRADPTGGVGINRSNLELLGGLEVPPPLPARAIFRLTFSFDQFADLTKSTAQRVLESGGFDPTTFHADTYDECQSLARAGTQAGWEALRAPSAAWRPDGYCVAIFQSGMSKLVRHRRYVEAARPTVAVAFKTTYKAGERPHWL